MEKLRVSKWQFLGLNNVQWKGWRAFFARWLIASNATRFIKIFPRSRFYSRGNWEDMQLPSLWVVRGGSYASTRSLNWRIWDYRMLHRKSWWRLTSRTWWVLKTVSNTLWCCWIFEFQGSHFWAMTIKKILLEI